MWLFAAICFGRLGKESRESNSALILPEIMSNGAVKPMPEQEDQTNGFPPLRQADDDVDELDGDVVEEGEPGAGGNVIQ